jgi:hypothetical protein
MSPASIGKLQLELYSYRSSHANKRAPGSSDGALFAKLSAVSLDKSRLRDLTSDLQIRALNHSGAPQYSVFLKIFVISNLREKQPNKPMFFWEKSAKTYPGARK